MANIISWLMPKEEKFFEMLKEQSNNALESAKELKSFVDQYAQFDRKERKSRAQIIKNIEHKGDEITHKIIDELNNRAAPIDKEHAYKIAISLDEIIDLANTVAFRFVLFGVERIDKYITKLVDIVLNAVGEVNKIISDLRKPKGIKEHLAKIYNLEKEADEIYHEALSELFHFYKNSIDIIKYKELYELLEKITDKCKEISRITEVVAFKYA
mgnify:CR=1 FL=1